MRPPVRPGAQRRELEERRRVRLLCLLHVPFVRGYCRLTWEGEENVPLQGGAVICSNHASHLDPSFLFYPVYFHRGRRLIRFFAVDIHYRGLQGAYRRTFEAIPVNKERSDLRAFRAAVDALRRGLLLGMFPEGERTPDGRLLEFQLGAAGIAVQAGVPLVPVTMNGMFGVLPRHRRFPRPGRVHIVFHPPIAVDASRRRDMDYQAGLTRRVEEAVRSRYREPEEVSRDAGR